MKAGDRIYRTLMKSCVDELNWGKKRIQKVMDAIDATPIGLIAQAFPDADFQKDSFSINIILPLQFQLIEDVRNFMKDQFPEFELYSDDRSVWGKNAVHYLTYKMPNDLQFGFQFRSSAKGSTCVLNPIGKKIIEQVEYEVVCSEAAASEFTMENA